MFLFLLIYYKAFLRDVLSVSNRVYKFVLNAIFTHTLSYVQFCSNIERIERILFREALRRNIYEKNKVHSTASSNVKYVLNKHFIFSVFLHNRIWLLKKVKFLIIDKSKVMQQIQTSYSGFVFLASLKIMRETKLKLSLCFGTNKVFAVVCFVK